MFRKNYYIARKIIKKIAPDIIYAWQLYDISVLPIIAAQECGIPCVFEIADNWLLDCKRDYDFKHSLVRRTFKFILRGIWDFSKLDCNYMNFCSDAIKQKYASAGFKGANFKVIPGGIKIYGRKISKIKDVNNVKLLCVARLVEDKGVHVAIETLAYLINKLKHSNITLDIFGAGDKDYTQRLEKIITTENLEKFVKFKGWITQDNLLQCIGNYDILLFPSVYDEPFARIILQAMDQGLPVVASNTGGTSEVVKNGLTGILVTKGNAVEMAEGVLKLLEDVCLFEQISINGNKAIQEKYSYRENIEQINNYLIGIYNQSVK